MDGANIFIYLLSLCFFGAIIYIARISRRNSQAEPLKPPVELNATPRTKDIRPRKVA